MVISGIDASAGCTKICSVCAEFLGRIREFRCKCEDGQKISSLLAERSVIPDFLNLDFSKPEDQYGGFSLPPSVDADFPEVDDFPDDEEDEEEEERPFKKVAKPTKEPKRVEQAIQSSKKLKKSDSCRRVVNNGKLQWVCLDCEQTFESCIKLKKHRQTCTMVGNENSKRVGPFTCDICGQSLPTLMGLRVHVHTHSKPGPEPKKKARSSNPSPKVAVCHVCGKSFTSMNSLRSHLVFHGQEKRIECQICNNKIYQLEDYVMKRRTSFPYWMLTNRALNMWTYC